MSIIFTIVPKLSIDAIEILKNLFASLEHDGHHPMIWLWNPDHQHDYEQLNLYLPESKSISSLHCPNWKWVARYRVWAKCTLTEALRWEKNTYDQVQSLMKNAPPKVFFCWNRSCCAFGYHAELLEQYGVKVRTIEWGCIPGSISMTMRLQNCPGWREPRDTPPLDSKDNSLFALPKITESGLYQQGKCDMIELLEQAEFRDVTPKVLFLGASEVDTFIIPAWSRDRSRHLPFSTNCKHLFRQICKINKSGATLFKPHPNHNYYSYGKTGARSAIVGGNPLPYLKWADIVVSTGSKMELNAVLLGKKLFCIGGGFLWGSGLSTDITTHKELKISFFNSTITSNFSNLEIKTALSEILASELLFPNMNQHNKSVLNYMIKH